MSHIPVEARGFSIAPCITNFVKDAGLQGEDLETIASDFLCDFIHWCDMKDVNFWNALSRAEDAHEDEVKQIQKKGKKNGKTKA
jgi:hypothetical protein